jgi:MEMO1 family protein
MHAKFCPRLRRHIQRIRDPRQPHLGYLVDELRQCPQPVQLPLEEYLCMPWFNGERTLREIQRAAWRINGDEMLPLERLIDLTRRLEEALLLDGPRWQQHIERPVREPVCIGCYDGDPGILSSQVKELFTRRGGPGLPEPCTQPSKSRGGGQGWKGRIRAALIPHIDYARGGVTYAWGFKEVFEHTDASLFVIVGTSHYSSNRFTLTRKNFKTPLGTVPTDQEFIDRLVRHYGDGLFDDELQAHLPEHSIELEVVFLQWLYSQGKPIRIVPLVVGSFHDAILLGCPPSALEDIERMGQALRCAEAETHEPICYIISGDLAHIGPKFNQGQVPVTKQDLAHSREQDLVLLERLEQADTMGFFQTLAQEKDARAICGFPPAFTVLEAIQPQHGKVLNYDRYVHPLGHESVSFASMAFY